jgi:peptidoglycan/LPS O-acetylase OafA/YrhL
VQKIALDTDRRPSKARGLLRERSQTLDILRGVAVLLVFTRHVNGLPFSTLGWIGVDLFFVLSGFLVSGLLFQEYLELGTVKPGTFLLRRAFKIYPQFYFFLAATVAALLATGQSFATINLFAEAAFFQNYHAGFWTHTWSLAVEEHFYLY